MLLLLLALSLPLTIVGLVLFAPPPLIRTELLLLTDGVVGFFVVFSSNALSCFFIFVVCFADNLALISVVAVERPFSVLPFAELLFWTLLLWWWFCDFLLAVSAACVVVVLVELVVAALFDVLLLSLEFLEVFVVLCSATSKFVMLSCFFHLVRRF